MIGKSLFSKLYFTDIQNFFLAPMKMKNRKWKRSTFFCILTWYQQQPNSQATMGKIVFDDDDVHADERVGIWKKEKQKMREKVIQKTQKRTEMIGDLWKTREGKSNWRPEATNIVSEAKTLKWT